MSENATISAADALARLEHDWQVAALEARLGVEGADARLADVEQRFTAARLAEARERAAERALAEAAAEEHRAEQERKRAQCITEMRELALTRIELAARIDRLAAELGEV